MMLCIIVLTTLDRVTTIVPPVLMSKLGWLDMIDVLTVETTNALEYAYCKLVGWVTRITTLYDVLGAKPSMVKLPLEAVDPLSTLTHTPPST